ncbi:MAG TPA: DNA cytosine methyltransferase [Gammaproteobacteria bacterium]|nr:DNA cytosine methyltransferase [Gammaproteobacteria bacterium]
MGPKICDVYAGVGGISLGASRAGFHLSAAVEWDEITLATHAKNFPKSKHLKIDVSTLTGRDLLVQAGLSRGELDGLVGGPPCQGFSIMGKRRPGDARNNLFVDFFRLVAEAKPKFFLAENVPGILDSQYDKMRRAALSHVTRKYVVLPPVVLKASTFGAPTTRTRVFFFGYLASAFKKDITEDDFRPIQTSSVYVQEALRGLPTWISPDWQSEEQGYRQLRSFAETEFLHKAANAIPRNVGDQKTISMLLDRDIVTGCLGTVHRPDVIRRFNRLKPGEQDKIGKMVRLNPKGFCPTIRAGTTKEHGHFQSLRPVHYSQPRVITPREAARLQTFPDWFTFHGTRYHSFRQIGNSVPPLLAEKILSVVRKRLR